MNLSHLTRLAGRACLGTALLLLLAVPSRAAFTEPPFTLYGRVIGSTINGGRAVTFGTLKLVIQPPGGAAKFSVTAQLDTLPDGLGYRLEIPVRKLTGETAAVPGVLDASTAARNYIVTQITIDNQPGKALGTLDGAPAALVFSERQRGKFQYLDFALVHSFVDSDRDGLPDWWEDQYASQGFNKNDPNDARADFNGDGVDNLAEYRAKNDPTATVITYAQWATAKGLAGANALPTADPDGDQVDNYGEFGADMNPLVPDRLLAVQRGAARLLPVGGTDRLAITVQKPVVKRADLKYVVEVSSDGRSWKSVEKKDVLTMQNDPTTLLMRDALRSSLLARRLIRLRVVSTDPSFAATSILGTWGSARLRCAPAGSTALGLPFVNAPVATGKVSNFSGVTIEDVAAVWNADQWIAEPHLVQITSGAGRGRSFPIINHTINLLIVDFGGSNGPVGLTAGDTYEIVPMNTLGGFFATGRGKLTAHANQAKASEVRLWNGIAFDAFYHDGSAWQAVGGGGISDDTLLYPDEGAVVFHRGTRPAVLSTFGLVPLGPQATALFGTTFDANRFPVDLKLSQTGLNALPGWSAADQVRMLRTNGNFTTYNFDGVHWRNSASPKSQDNVLIKSGAAIFIDRAAGAPEVTWRQLPPQ